MGIPEQAIAEFRNTPCSSFDRSAARLILAISLTVAAACGVLGTFSILQQRSLMRLALEQQFKLQYDSVIAAIDYEGRAALAVSAVIAALPPVGDAIAKGDRDGAGGAARGPDEGAERAGHPADHVPSPAGDVVLPGSRAARFSATMSPARRNTVVEAIKTGKPIVGVEPGRRGARDFRHDADPARRQEPSANTDVGAAFGKEFVDRAKKRFGIDLAVHSFDGKEFKRLSSTFGDTVVATPEELKGVFNGAALHRDASFDGHPAALYVGQIRNYAGQPVGGARGHQGHHRI